MVDDFTELDFFRVSELIADPYPYYEALRQQCPVAKEKHHGVTMVTGWDEACAVLNDAETWSSCISVTGPFPGFPVPLQGDDLTGLEAAGKSGADAILAHFSGASPTIAKLPGLEHFDLQADVNGEAWKSAGELGLARRSASGGSGASRVCGSGGGLSFLISSHANQSGSSGSHE